jgi:3-dehydroquinate dehydratase-2
MVITIINGPNLNLLGKRESSIYGQESFDSILESLRSAYKHVDIRYFQSNVEGEIVDHLQKSSGDSDGIILNAGGYTHTSVAIRDAILAIERPVIEVHISNILKREEFRHTSLLSSVCSGTMFGFGIRVYELALEAFVKKII